MSSTTSIRFDTARCPFRRGPLVATLTCYAVPEGLTIHQRELPAAADSEALALRALGWVLSEPDRASRLLALTGLSPATLREGLDQRAVLAAILDFLASHEPDLLAAAKALDTAPEQLIAASRELGQ